MTIDRTLLDFNDPDHESPDACECHLEGCEECRRLDAEWAAYQEQQANSEGASHAV